MSLRDQAAETVQQPEFTDSANTAVDITQGNYAISSPRSRPDTSSVTVREALDHNNHVVRLPPRHRVTDGKNRFVAHKEWEGRVISVDHVASVFWAGLIDLASGESHETEQAEISMSNVQDYDRDLVRPGAIFRWVIGTRYLGNTKERSSRIVFRRLPAWSEKDLAEIEKDAEALESLVRQRRVSHPT